MKLPYEQLDAQTIFELNVLLDLVLMSEQAGGFQPEFRDHLIEVNEELRKQSFIKVSQEFDFSNE
jgi:hypothetical protein